MATKKSEGAAPDSTCGISARGITRVPSSCRILICSTKTRGGVENTEPLSSSEWYVKIATVRGRGVFLPDMTTTRSCAYKVAEKLPDRPAYRREDDNWKGEEQQVSLASFRQDGPQGARAEEDRQQGRADYVKYTLHLTELRNAHPGEAPSVMEPPNKEPPEAERLPIVHDDGGRRVELEPIRLNPPTPVRFPKLPMDELLPSLECPSLDGEVVAGNLVNDPFGEWKHELAVLA